MTTPNYLGRGKHTTNELEEIIEAMMPQPDVMQIEKFEGKTIREWFEEFPEPYKSQALKNINPLHSNIIKPSKYDALYTAFKWESTSEGGEYWVDFLLTLKK